MATDSKRPLVLTANDPFSNHLLKFYLSSEIIFNFKHPPKQHLSEQYYEFKLKYFTLAYLLIIMFHIFFIVCYLQLLALNEGAIMSENEIETFLHPLKPDIRQSILQLQFILNTGKLNEV